MRDVSSHNNVGWLCRYKPEKFIKDGQFSWGCGLDICPKLVLGVINFKHNLENWGDDLINRINPVLAMQIHCSTDLFQALMQLTLIQANCLNINVLKQYVTLNVGFYIEYDLLILPNTRFISNNLTYPHSLLRIGIELVHGSSGRNPHNVF